MSHETKRLLKVIFEPILLLLLVTSPVWLQPLLGR